jgi:hypothetical protein
MSPYMGGSAPAMANQVAEGYTMVTAVQLKRLTDPELDLLQFELERILRDLRGSVVPQDEAQAAQLKNRKLARVVGALQQIGATKLRRKR